MNHLGISEVLRNYGITLERELQDHLSYCLLYPEATERHLKQPTIYANFKIKNDNLKSIVVEALTSNKPL